MPPRTHPNANTLSRKQDPGPFPVHVSKNPSLGHFSARLTFVANRFRKRRFSLAEGHARALYGRRGASSIRGRTRTRPAARLWLAPSGVVLGLVIFMRSRMRVAEHLREAIQSSTPRRAAVTREARSRARGPSLREGRSERRSRRRTVARARTSCSSRSPIDSVRSHDAERIRLRAFPESRGCRPCVAP